MSRPFYFVFLYLLVSNVYSWSAKELQISHINFSMFTGIIIVIVNI